MTSSSSPGCSSRGRSCCSRPPIFGAGNPSSMSPPDLGPWHGSRRCASAPGGASSRSTLPSPCWISPKPRPRFQTWCRSEVLRGILMDIANELRERGVLDEKECFIDATFVMAKGGGAEVGPTKRGKGMKIMAIVDRHGLPLSVSTHAANHHEVRLVQLCFDFYMIEAK